MFNTDSLNIKHRKEKLIALHLFLYKYKNLQWLKTKKKTFLTGVWLVTSRFSYYSLFTINVNY